MPGSGISQGARWMDPNTCKRRLRFRSHNYGTRELDLLLGQFADKYLDSFDLDCLQAYESLLEKPLPDLFAWITGAAPLPDSEINPVLPLLIAFCRKAHEKPSGEALG